MEKLIELGFVCQYIYNSGELVSVCVRDARNGKLVYAGSSREEMVAVLANLTDDASRFMDAQVKAMDNA